jgi:lipid A 3-O-deacylase
MRRSLPVALLFLLAFVLPAAAQTPPAPAATQPSVSPDGDTLLGKGDSEFMLTAGAAYGIVVFHSAGGHRFVLQTTSWARVLSETHLPGPLRGRFAWAVEAVPLFGQYEPTKTYGFGVSPLVWRWNFVGRGNVMPYAELAGGGLWTTEPVPDRTTTGNFTAHAGGGVRFFLGARRALVVNYWFHHISNGNRLERNPGVNSHIVQVGLSYVPPRH